MQLISSIYILPVSLEPLAFLAASCHLAAGLLFFNATLFQPGAPPKRSSEENGRRDATRYISDPRISDGGNHKSSESSDSQHSSAIFPTFFKVWSWYGAAGL